MASTTAAPSARWAHIANGIEVFCFVMMSSRILLSMHSTSIACFKTASYKFGIFRGALLTFWESPPNHYGGIRIISLLVPLCFRSSCQYHELRKRGTRQVGLGG